MNAHDIYSEAVGDLPKPTGPTSEEIRTAMARAERKRDWIAHPETNRILEILEEQFQGAINNLLDMAMSGMASSDDVRRLAIAASQLKQTIEKLKKD